MSQSSLQFSYGVQVGGAVGGWLSILLYAVAAPTPDIRARMAFLLELSSVLAACFGILLCASLLALAATRMFSARALAGVFVSSTAIMLIIGTRVPERLMPPFEDPTTGWIVVILVALAVGVLLVWERRVLTAK
jgi:hypothetical protein